MRSNDKMQEGLYTMVIRVSGNQDPMNDSDATLEIGLFLAGQNRLRDARGGIAIDYSYRILQSRAMDQQAQGQHAFSTGWWKPAKQVEHLHTPRIAWFYDQIRKSDNPDFSVRAKIRLVTVSADGLSATGLVGG